MASQRSFALSENVYEKFTENDSGSQDIRQFLRFTTSG
jgi:hypothetical protein